MSKNNSSGGEGAFLAAAVVVIVGAGAYFVLKGWAESLGLQISSLVYLIIGAGFLAAGLIACLFFDVYKRSLLPWWLPLFGMFCLPALTDWATPRVGPFAYAASENVAWFGTWWGQSLIILALAAIAFAWMKWLDDGY